MNNNFQEDPIDQLIKSLVQTGQLLKRKKSSAVTTPLKINPRHTLSTYHPHLAKEWHPNKNGALTPDQVTYGSNKKVWWQCLSQTEHEWVSSIKERHRGSKCPHCPRKVKKNDSTPFFSLFPELMHEWHLNNNNDIDIQAIESTSTQIAWWKCREDPMHEWQATIFQRTHGAKCPFCANHKPLYKQTLAEAFPDIARELHSHLNGNLTAQNLMSIQRINVWWQCAKEPTHIWQKSIHSRTQHHTKCPFCLFESATEINKEQYLYNPKITELWHTTRNTGKTLNSVRGKKIWLQCDVNPKHEWQVSSSAQKISCPHCHRLIACYPDIAREFHPWKNHPRKIDDIRIDAKSAFWWRCHKNNSHVWKCPLPKRITGDGCPTCLKE